MRIALKLISFAGVTLLASAFSLSSAFASDLDHARFRVKRAAIAYKYIDQDGQELNVSWSTEKLGIYKLELTRSPDADSSRPISLFSIGLQGRLWNATVTEAACEAGRIAILDTRGQELAWIAGSPLPWVVPQINPPPTPPKKWNHTKINPLNICFLKFPGTRCTLTVEVPGGNPRVRNAMPFVASSGLASASGEDDWAPPPPDPGGEYGEDPDDDDDDDDDGGESQKPPPVSQAAPPTPSAKSTPAPATPSP